MDSVIQERLDLLLQQQIWGPGKGPEVKSFLSGYLASHDDRVRAETLYLLEHFEPPDLLRADDGTRAVSSATRSLIGFVLYMTQAYIEDKAIWQENLLWDALEMLDQMVAVDLDHFAPIKQENAP